MIRQLRLRWRVSQFWRAIERYEEMRRISDDFGWGPILRYGEDRWGDKPYSAARNPR